MDQENLSAFHVTKPFCTNSAINTDPVGCAACGSRNYFQISSLPYPLQMYHTYLPSNLFEIFINFFEVVLTVAYLFLVSLLIVIKFIDRFEKKFKVIIL